MPSIRRIPVYIEDIPAGIKKRLPEIIKKDRGEHHPDQVPLHIEYGPPSGWKPPEPPTGPAREDGGTFEITV